MKYRFSIIREQKARVEVDADNRDEAYDEVYERYIDGDYEYLFREMQTDIEQR